MSKNPFLTWNMNWYIIFSVCRQNKSWSTVKTKELKLYAGSTWIEWAICLTAIAFSVILIITKADLAIDTWTKSIFQTPFWQYIWQSLSSAGKASFQITVCVGVAIYYYWRQQYNFSRVWYMSIPIFLILGALVHPLKFLFGRPRPKMLHHDMYNFEWFELPARLHSYPSGHTITTFCLFATVCSFYSRKTQAIFFIIAALLGYARVGAASHYLGDVVCAAALGYLGGRYLKMKFEF